MQDNQAELEEFGQRWAVAELAPKLVQFVSIMLYVLVAGVMWGTWLSLARTMTEYDAETFLADGQHMISNLATVMAVLMTPGATTFAVIPLRPRSMASRRVIPSIPAFDAA